MHQPVVVDVGAHHGVYAILLGKAAQRKQGIVVAIEPNPASFKILERNVQLNNLEDTVRCENIGIMDLPGVAQIVDEDDQSRIVKPDEQGGYRVDVLPLSDILKKHSLTAVDVLIIDVEGAELKVLQSIDWERCKVATIFCELHPYNWKFFGYSGREMKEFFLLHGYRCFDMYLREHTTFDNEAYVGPTFLVSERV
jgi:FkbM family methyltransferase